MLNVWDKMDVFVRGAEIGVNLAAFLSFRHDVITVYRHNEWPPHTLRMKSSACKMQQSLNRLVCPLLVNCTRREGYAPGPPNSTERVTHSSPRMTLPLLAATYQTRQGILSLTIDH